MDFHENRCGGNHNRLFPGCILRKEDHEIKTRGQGYYGRHPDYAPCSSAYCSGILPAFAFQPEKTLWKIFASKWTGCVIAASVIAFPLMYRNTRAAFEQVDVNLIYAGRTLGMSESRIFWKVIMPAAGPGIASGTVLAFARAIGEYGATSMLAGNILGKTRTVSVAIASETAAGNFDMAGFWVVVIILISFLVVAAINIVSGRGMQTRRWI